MSKLVSHDEERFIVRSFLNRGIPDHHALRGSQPRHVSVDLVGFPARLHQEDALRWNGNTYMFRKFFNRSNQVWMLLAQRFEFVEQRIDHQRSDHDHSKQNQDRRKPEIQPPAARTAPHHGEKDQDQNDSKRDMEKFPLAPIPEPRTPALYRLLIVHGKRMPNQAHRQSQNVDG